MGLLSSVIPGGADDAGGGIMIVKVQRPLPFSTGRGILIYNEERDVEYLEEDPKSIKAITKHIDGADKAFCRARMRGTKIELGCVLQADEWPEW